MPESKHEHTHGRAKRVQVNITPFHAWKIGLKTGIYYLRTRPKADAIQFTVNCDALTGKEGELGTGDKEALAACRFPAGEGNEDSECCFCGA